ncbi:MAG: phosphoribosyltransferase [Sphingobacteriales bacterium]|nr:MAG: phosphoribosyltransferase [Sphingobacteriales bacterium]
MKRELILNTVQVQQKINRIAYQILEDSFEENEIIIVGVWARGYRLALRLNAVLQKISNIKISVASILLDKDIQHYDATNDIAQIDCTHKTVIIVDDVLNSGRTLAYGLGKFLNIPLKKLRSVVLIDRSHKLFPLTTDFTGLQLSTVLKEHVEVILDEAHESDAVYIT